MSKRVAFDLDDTLLDFKTLASSAITKHTGIDKHWTEWNTYDLGKVYDYKLTGDDLRDIWYTEKVIENAPVRPHALELVNECIDSGMKISIITARRWHPEAEQVTLNWLERNGIHHDELILTGHGDSKVDSIPHNEKYMFVVDDHIDHCRAFAESQRFENVYLAHAPWNASEIIKHESITRTHCLSEINEKMRGA